MRPGINSSNSNKPTNRNAVEKNRRLHMKDLYSKLASLIPNQSSKERLPLRAILDQATNYVARLKEHVEELNRRKEQIKLDRSSRLSLKEHRSTSILPSLTLRDMGSTLEVHLMTGFNTNFSLHQLLSVLEEEGADVVNVSYSIAGDKIFYTIYSQAFYSRIGIETSRVHERLKELIAR